MLWWALGIAALWILFNAKTSRPDGTLIKVHPYRKMLGYIMPGRNESVCYYDDFARAEPLLDFLEKAGPAMGANITHCLVGAVGIALEKNPKLNTFVSGRRFYRRHERTVTFSMKRKKLDKEAKLSAVKLSLQDGQSFAELCSRINAEVNKERSGEKTYTDKEFDLFTPIPRVILEWLIRLAFRLDYYNLLPKSFMQNDGMYTSCFIANLGSINMRPAYHHLFEWGNCPLFMMVGKVEERALVVDGKVEVAKVIPMRWSYDERIDDGLTASYGMTMVREVLENPTQYLGAPS